MPQFSLIAATRERTEELARLTSSLQDQGTVDYELIVVDQNDDDRLLPLLKQAGDRDRIVHLRCAPGVSRARNLGLEQACGEILAFPDDDCWYPPGLLQSVAEWFGTHPEYDILSVNSLDANGERSSNRWFQDSCDLRLVNIYRTSVGYGYFLRSTPATRALRYDVGLGPGATTPYLGGEDTDYLLDALEHGLRGRFEAKWHVGHPRKDIRQANVSRERIYIYGLGMGFVQRKHRLFWLWLFFAFYDFARAAVVLPLGRAVQSRLWYWHGRGLVAGFLRRGQRNPVGEE